MPDISLLIAIAALVGAAFSARSVWRRRDVSRWPAVEATIIDHEITERVQRAQEFTPGDQPRRYQPRVVLRFSAAGQQVETDNRHFDGVPSFARREAAEAYLQRFPKGELLRVRHHPDDPRIVQFGTQRIPLQRLGLTLFLLLLAAALLLLRAS